ncbi:MAG: DUF2808 domain-containing protein [Elainellaceae cyanobacterium]
MADPRGLQAKRLGVVRSKRLRSMAIATVSAVGLGVAAAVGGSGLPGRAAQLSGGRVYFDRPPSLLDVSTTVNAAGSASSIFYFTLDVPANAGEPLQTVVITQDTGTSPLGEIDFDTDDVEAFIGSRRQRGEELILGPVDWNEPDHQLTISFNPPVEPGTEVTLRIEPRRNPRRSGVYLFGVTAFPSGEVPQGQFLGYGRLHFYDRGDRVPFSNRLQRHRFTHSQW